MVLIPAVLFIHVALTPMHRVLNAEGLTKEFGHEVENRTGIAAASISKRNSAGTSNYLGLLPGCKNFELHLAGSSGFRCFQKRGSSEVSLRQFLSSSGSKLVAFVA